MQLQAPKSPMVGAWMLCENEGGLGGRYHGWDMVALRHDGPVNPKNPQPSHPKTLKA